MIEIIIRKPRRPKPLLPDAPDRFEAFLGDRKLCASRQPLLTSARILLREGADPADRLAMRWEGSDHIALSGVIGELAKWTVYETRKVGPTFRRMDPNAVTTLRAPMRLNVDVLSE